MSGGADSRAEERAAGHGEPEHGTKISLVSAASIRPEAVRYAWRGRIPLGAVSLLVGDPGLGKSTTTLELAARLSRGQLEGDLFGEPVTVLLATAEDAIAHVVVPRLIAAGADLERVKVVAVRRDGMTGGLMFPDDLPRLRDRVLAERPRIFIVDPLVAHLSDEVNSHRDQDVRRAVAPLARLAEEADLAVVGIVHLNKATAAHVLSRVAGSVAFVAAARSLLLLGPDPDDRDGPTRILAHGKSNVGPLAPALRLRIEAREIPGDAGAIITSGVAWVGEALGLTASDLVAPEAPEERDAVTDAVDFLRDLFAGRERVESRTVEQALREAVKARSITERGWRRARKKLHITSKKEGWSGTWFWVMRAEAGEDVRPREASIFGANGSGGAGNPAPNAEDGRWPEDGREPGEEG